MKKVLAFVMLCTLVFALCACGGSRQKSSNYSGSSYSGSSKSDYSFSDYLKDADPDLYDAITDRYNSLTP